MNTETVPIYDPTDKQIRPIYSKRGNNLKKGKNYTSFTLDPITKQILPTWIAESGGNKNDMVQKFQLLIDKNYDKMAIAALLNISPTTAKNFIKKYVDLEYQTKAQENFIKNTHIRRVTKITGLSKSTKGKTYKEIYGTSMPGCGFQKGLNNPNFTCQKFRGKSVINKLGEKYRSSYEVEFSELLHDHFIPFEYEHRFKLLNNQCKVVDFVVGDIFIEITGYAYEKWRQDFDIKIQLLHQTYPDKKILLCSRNDKRPIINDLRKHENEKITVLSLDEPQTIIAYIKANTYFYQA